MYELDLQKAEEPESKWPTIVESWRKQGSSRKTATSASVSALNPLTVWITTYWKILKEMEIPDLRNFYVSQESTVKTRHGTMTG